MTRPKLTEARLPRGLADRGPADLARERKMLETIRQVYERYGFEAVETPFLEYTDALGKFLPDQDRPNAGVFSLKDDDEQWMSLRYDLTAPLARYVAENFERLPKPYRSYRCGYVFRNEKPGPGRFRQFMQFDADTVGASSVAADAENCMMFADAMEALGIPRGSYVVRVNNRKVLDGLMEAIGIGGPEHAGTRLTVLRAIDKMDKFPVEEIRKLLGPGRMDESGDFTKGAGLGNEAANAILELMQSGWIDDAVHEALDIAPSLVEALGPLKELDFIDEDFEPSESVATNAIFKSKFLINQKYRAGSEELVSIERVIRAAGYGPDRIRIDPSVVRGLEYYTGPVYEVELTFEVKGEDGRPVRFGSVGGGGRYDGLVGRFREGDVPATGISIGVSRLLAALKHLQKDAAEPDGPVVVTVMDRARIADYQLMVTELRNAGFRAELYLGDGGFKPQLKYADRRNAPLAIIQGSDEAEKGLVQIKDLKKGAELAAMAKSGADRESYLAKQAEAQVLAPRAKLVARVKAMLAG